MALELFKPFIYNKLETRGLVSTIKQAKEMVEQQRPEVWDILEEVIREHPVLLNRAPTLHRLGIQAFEPVLVEGKAIRIHPLVCTAFNADFDGDQMAVHIPLSPEAQIEASVLMMSSNNILSPSNGAPIAVPSQDIVLGCYYMTKAKSGAKGEGRAFGNIDDVLLALEAGELETLSPIRLRFTGSLMDLTTARDNQDLLHTESQAVKSKIINTTVGRVLLNEQLPKEMPFVNGLLKKKGLQQLVQKCYLDLGLERTVEMLDALKHLGFTYATRSGLSIGIDDLVIPGNKAQLVENARAEVIKVEQQYLEGQLPTASATTRSSPGRRHRKGGRRNVRRDGRADRTGRSFNPVYIMADPGARGSSSRPPAAALRGLTAAVGRNHRGADHRTSVKASRWCSISSPRTAPARVGRTRRQDRRLRLPHAASGGRGAGRHHLGGRLRHARRHRGARHRRIGRDHRTVARPYRRPRDARAHRRPVHERFDRRRQR
jgi:DNA-directed RNA polymerase subunit beta'